MSNDTPVKASFRGKASKIQQMIDKSALTGAGDPLHSNVWINVRDGVLDIVASLPGNVTVSYCTFEEGEYLDDISVSDEQKEATEDGKVPTAEAVLDVQEFLTYLSFASDGGTIEIELLGQQDDRLSHAIEYNGALNARIFIPASTSALEEMALGTPSRFNDDNELVSEETGNSLPTVIETSTDQVNKVIQVVEEDENLDFFPIVTEEGDFVMNVGRDSDDSRNSVWGELQASSVEGPDISNTYHEGFKSVFKTLSGEVTLSSAPADGGAPLCVVQDEFSGSVLRHIVGPTGSN